MARERLAVHRIGQERLRRQRFLACQGAAELLLDLELLRAPLDFLFAAVGAEEDELARFRLHAGLVEHLAQRKAGPASVARQPLQRPSVARALEAGDQLLPAHATKVVERQRDRPVDKPGYLQLERR